MSYRSTLTARHGTGSFGHRVNGSSFTSGSPSHHFDPVWDPRFSGFRWIADKIREWVPGHRWTYDNAQRHVTAFKPVSEAAHSWSYDNQIWKNTRLKILHSCDIFNLVSIIFGCGTHYRASAVPRYTVIHPEWCWALPYVHRFMVTRCDIIMSHGVTSRDVQ